MKIHFKKILVSLLVILGFVFYAFYQRNTNVQQNFLSVPQDSTSKTQLVFEQPLNTIDTTTSTSNPPEKAPESISLRENEDGEEDEDEYEDEYEDEEDYYANQSLTPDTTTTTSAPASTSTTTTTTSVAPAETTTTTVNATCLYKDGQYDGNAADAYYGFVQVRAIVQGGKIVDVQFLSYPNDRSYSVEINNYAMPKLKTEAIKVQNAQVNIVTGATNTSRAFITSLSSALNQAQV